MRPLDRIPSIKLKLGIVIVAAVAVSSIVSYVGFQLGLPIWIRPVIASVIALAMVQLLARGMTSPLREMADAASAMARGDYDRRVRATASDEVGRLAAAFNALATDLAVVDRMRRDLVANVSHELRTPISALQAVLENIVDGVEPADPETLKTMLDQAQRLGRLVAQLLDLSRLESGAVPLDRRPFDVAEVLRRAVQESTLHANDVRVELSVGSPSPLADGDPERVHQVVANLLNNALRYSPPGGAVTVEAHQRRDHVELTVSDEGPGIPEGERARVFERFYRADSARASSSGGSGLGLAIARWIVDLHGGDIRAESRRPRGCRIVVHLPAATGARP